MTKLCDTCEYLRYCARSGIEEVGCDRYKKDTSTNEQWLRSASTEQLAKWLSRITNAGYLLALRMKYHCDDVDAVREWLKQPHTP